jgi:hypothetical protein
MKLWIRYIEDKEWRFEFDIADEVKDFKDWCNTLELELNDGQEAVFNRPYWDWLISETEPAI